MNRNDVSELLSTCFPSIYINNCRTIANRTQTRLSSFTFVSFVLPLFSSSPFPIPGPIWSWSIGLWLVNLDFFRCHIHWSKVCQLSVLYALKVFILALKSLSSHFEHLIFIGSNILGVKMLIICFLLFIIYWLLFTIRLVYGPLINLFTC